ncbi:DUF6538 domain-containing protein [Paraburkholderia graminis]|uniref:DUF6538 domain-containing protein n=1 Tax=Paraburkholderia graminis TaxID=60548 RepID=UPI0038BD854B
MSQTSHVLVRRESRVPYFRRSIPKPLRSQFGRREFICSLRTTETAEAERRAAALLAKTEDLLRYARRARGRFDILPNSPYRGNFPYEGLTACGVPI